MNLGVFGGSFDPVHIGHLRVAQACREAVPLDMVLFIPAARQPLKSEGPAAAAEDRLQMLRLALEGRPGFAVSDLEITRGGVSYTVDTLRQLAREHVRDRLYLILGADALRDLPSWREPDEICRLATLLVVDRPETVASTDLTLACTLLRVPMEPVEVSSTEIRRRVARDEPIADLIPDAVAAYIAERNLYR